MMDEEALHAAYELGRYDASKLLRKAHKAENESLRNVVEAVAAEIRSLASEFDEENKEGPAGRPCGCAVFRRSLRIFLEHKPTNWRA